MAKAIKALEAAVGSVPNGTDIITPEVAVYVDRYRHFAKQSAESIINLALTLIEAEEKLNKSDFSTFCAEVGIDGNGATYRKLKSIATNSARFAPVMDRLPNTWTTIYKLASLEADKFEDLVANGVISPFMTMSDVNKQLDVEKQNKSANDNREPDFTISMDNLDTEVKSAVYELIKELCTDFSLQLVMAKRLEQELSDFNRKQAA